MRLIDADALVKVLGIAENCSDCKYQNGTLCAKANYFVDACEAIFDAPTIDPVKNKLQRALVGKTEEETYDFLSWLMFDYAKQYTDSRSAVIQWLREDGIERGR